MRVSFLILSIIIHSILSTSFVKTGNEGQFYPVDSVEYQPWELVLDVAWSPDGKWLAVSSGNYVRLYAMPGFESVWDFEIGALTHSVAFDPDGEYLAAGSRDGSIRVWRVSDFNQPEGENHPPNRIIKAHRKGVNQLVFDPQGKSLASGGNDAVARIWEISAAEETRMMIGGTLTVAAIDFHPDGEILAVSNGNVIRMRDIESEGIVGSFRSENPLFCLQFDKDGGALAAGDLENQILLWNTDEAYRTGVEKYPQPVILAGHNGRVNSFKSIIWDIKFSPTGKLLASGGGDGNIFLWDLEKKQALTSIQAHDLGVTSVEFDPEGQYLVSGGLDASVRLWRLEK